MSPTPSRSTGAAALLLLASATSLQFGAAIAAQLFPVVGPTGVNALRLATSAIVLLLFVRPRAWRWNSRQWRHVLVFGLAMAGMNGFFYLAIDRIPLGTAVAIEFLGPLLLSAALSKRHRELLWVGIAALGMLCLGADSIFGGQELDPLGVVFALAAALFWAGYILASSRVGETVPGKGGLAVALTVAALVSMPIGASGIAIAATDLRLLGLATLTGILASVVPYTLEFIALRQLPKSVFGVLMSLEPAVATLFGWLLLGQTPSLLKLATVALVITASIGSALSARRQIAVDLPADPATGPIEVPVLPTQVDARMDEEAQLPLYTGPIHVVDSSVYDAARAREKAQREKTAGATQKD